jgi:hypothetical protein
MVGFIEYPAGVMNIGTASSDGLNLMTSNTTRLALGPLGGVSVASGNNLSVVSGKILQGTQTAYPNVMWSASGTTTGAVIIKLPGTTSNYGMLHMQIDVYEYSSNSTTSFIIGGHNWSSAWYNYSSRTIGPSNKKIRLAVKDGQFAVVLGDNTSTWSYGHVVLSKITNGGYYPNSVDLGGTYTITLDSSAESYTWISSNLNSGGVLTGTGTANYVSKWTGTTTQGNSLIYDNGTNVGIGTTDLSGQKLMINSDQGNVANSALKIIYNGGTTVLGEVAALAHRNSQ